ncbi:MAG: nitroreductase family protein [Actinomycetia bacterium]|nr:nitroreductase family protein [Actinomycetes bacterium]
MEIFEALYTTRAMRRVSSDPIPGDVVRSMLDAAIRSPSGGNSQNWRWLTVTDRSAIGVLGELYAEAWVELNETFYKGKKEAAEERGDEATKRVLSSSQWLADNFEKVPLVVFPFFRNDPSGASIYPGVWSMMLAARAHNVGTTLTTVLGIFKQKEVADLLGVPPDKGWQNAAAITCGYPLGKWGLAKRAPVQNVVYEERWGTSPGWSVDESLWKPTAQG